MIRWGAAMGQSGLETERLNFLTDGVYAIAITLLVLELKVPEHLRADELLPTLLAEAPKFITYLIAFSACAIGWTFTYLSHGLVRRAGPGHLFCTLVSLLAVGLIPFSSALMGEYPDSPWGVVAYALDVGLLAAVYAVDLMLAARSLPAHVDRRPIRLLYGTAWAVAGIGALAGGWLAFLSPRLCLYIIAAVTAAIWIEYFFLVGWIGRAIEALAAERPAHAPVPAGRRRRTG
jgi:uncharacterized membrane protein